MSLHKCSSAFAKEWPRQKYLPKHFCLDTKAPFSKLKRSPFSTDSFEIVSFSGCTHAYSGVAGLVNNAILVKNIQAFLDISPTNFHQLRASKTLVVSLRIFMIFFKLLEFFEDFPDSSSVTDFKLGIVGKLLNS